MRLRTFLWDRLPYIACYSGLSLLILIVVQLDLWISGQSLRFANLLYIGLLGVAGLFLFLFVEYGRQAEFLRRLSSVSRTEPLDELGLLPPPKTLEQRVVAQAWGQLYSRLRTELTREQDRGRQNLLLISQWAHHMKTPVAVIDLELQKAAAAPGAPDSEPLLASLAEENQRLSHSLQMVLNLVRLEDFAADFRIEPVDLVALVRGYINEHKRGFIVHRVYPRLELPEGEVPLIVRSDGKWLRLVLEQIVSNAIKYASRPEQDGHVTFRCRRDGDETVLEVADNGIGIAPEDLGRVFTPFYTGANGRIDTRSTGMGLYLVREACRRLGHQVALESRLGEGTALVIRFAADRSLAAGLTER